MRLLASIAIAPDVAVRESSKGAPEIHYCERIEGFETFLNCFERGGTVDVMELFGGEAGVMKPVIKRGLRSGGNVDLVTHWNLLNPEHVRQFVRFRCLLKPAVLIMAM